MTQVVTAPQKWDSVTVKVESPDGTLYVTILEDSNNEPCMIHISGGKNGASLYAWAKALADSLTTSLNHGATISELIQDLSSQTSHRSAGFNVKLRSGPEAVAQALIDYSRMRFDKLRESLGDFDEGNRRPPRMAG